ATGQPCLTDDNCRPSDACDNFGQARLGKCVARLPLEAACEVAAQCQSAFCDDAVCSQPDADDVYCAAQQ
ncbi:MAG TPA: hypothetical protein VJR89_18720, partial [Polyangiales bacterium]|nr:hypothetical protein [Polyangiales bacterium]